MNNPVFESMIKVLKTYAGKKISPSYSTQSEIMRQRWADHNALNMRGKLVKTL